MSTRGGPPEPDPNAETVVEPPAEGRVVEEEVVPAPPPRPPRIWPWLLALLLLVVAGLIAFFLVTRQNDKTTMPRVVGLTEPAARARLADAELEVDVDRRRSDKPAGIVVAQTPGAGTQLDEGERVEITVSSGLNTISVPNVRGLKEAQAKTRLAATGLKSKVERVFAGAPKSVVVDTDPPGGERVAGGTTVTLKVSKGRNLAKVPDVVGRSEDGAVVLLRARGFSPRVFDVPSPLPQGIVVSQSPPAGAQAPPDSRVRINVSSGKPSGQTTERTATTAPANQVTVPVVVGVLQTPALRLLRGVGLKGVVVYAKSKAPRSRVIAQRPKSGQLSRGTQVTITVSAGTEDLEQIDVPDVRGSDLQTATQTLESGGFVVETIRTAAGTTVNDQQPAPGTTAPLGAVITLFFGG